MPNHRIVEVEEAPYLYNERTCSMAPDDISRNMGMAFWAVGALIGAEGLTSASHALSVYYTHDDESMTFRAGFLVSEERRRKGRG